jgi:hypothetical protein
MSSLLAQIGHPDALSGSGLLLRKNIVQLAVFGIAIIATGFAGHATGLENRRSRMPGYVKGLLINIVILYILDRLGLASPHSQSMAV